MEIQCPFCGQLTGVRQSVVYRREDGRCMERLNTICRHCGFEWSEERTPVQAIESCG